MTSIQSREAQESAWTPAIEAMREASCSPYGCRLRYLGAMETQPSLLIRHDNWAQGPEYGADIKIDNYFAHITAHADLVLGVQKTVDEHHVAWRAVGLKTVAAS